MVLLAPLAARAPARACPRMVDLDVGVNVGAPLLLLLAGGFALRGVGNSLGEDAADELTRRSMRDRLIVSPELAPPPPPRQAGPSPIVTSTITPEGAALLTLVEGDAFDDAWLAAVSELGRSVADAPPSDGSLTGRVEEVRARAHQRRVLGDALATAVERAFVEQSLRMLGSVDAIAPGAVLPFDAATLVRASQQFPGQSARQVRAFVEESAPSTDASVVGRFDRLQAARLYMGCTQFGYFISQIFRGQVGLDDETRLTPEEAGQIQKMIVATAKQMRSEAAWAAASRRAGALFALPREGGAEEEELGGWDDSQGYEALREFSSGVQVVAPSQQDEFFAKPNGDGALGGVGPGGPIDPLPTAEFVRFNAAGLQAILAEGCLYGWHLWGAEAAARAQLGAAKDELLTPPVATVE